MVASKIIRLFGLPREIDMMQRNICNAVDSLSSISILDGIAIKSISLTAYTPTILEHRLGRAPQGWLVTDKNTDANVWSTNKTDKFLYLTSSMDTTISLWVY